MQVLGTGGSRHQDFMRKVVQETGFEARNKTEQFSLRTKKNKHVQTMKPNANPKTFPKRFYKQSASFKLASNKLSENLDNFRIKLLRTHLSLTSLSLRKIDQTPDNQGKLEPLD